jgi:DNA-binding FrmR family transcriptional regulator
MVKDKEKLTKYLNVAQGQINGIKQMINDDAYCIDISNQILATVALLKKVNHIIITNHLETCVKDASKCGEIDDKIDELKQLFNRLDY